jgi:tetratricopeptide (TPR) repeat protein
MPELHFSLGLLLWRRRDDAAANAEFRKETQINPEFPRSWFYIGEIALRNGQTFLALRSLTTALDLNPNQYDALCKIAMCYQMLHQDYKAIEILQIAVKLNPAGQNAHYHLSRLLRKEGRTEEAAREQEIVLQNTDSAKFRIFGR